MVDNKYECVCGYQGHSQNPNDWVRYETYSQHTYYLTYVMFSVMMYKI